MTHKTELTSEILYTDPQLIILFDALDELLVVRLRQTFHHDLVDRALDLWCYTGCLGTS